ncbi:hypothetical protein PVK06_008023 [Gossypium arboreum]|uniref:Uncharacterized protein n=1 Tax=Gossypium arboreum TaxID=29729 RepID=A0ABR0QJ23_GOSAR|nr:hypothetical protein PVK06_008023 [Gossypium arboreum]
MVETLSAVDTAVGKSSAGSNSGVGRATKKLRHSTDVPLDLNGPTVDRNGQAVRETNMPTDSFQDKNDFDKVLMGGPWVIFGHYLTVRLWSLDFSTVNDILDKQVDMANCKRHSSNFCLRRQVAGAKVAAGQNELNEAKLDIENRVEKEPLGLWLLMDRRQKGKWRSLLSVKIDGVNHIGGSRFSMLETDSIQIGSACHTRIEEKSDEIVNRDGISA